MLKTLLKKQMTEVFRSYFYDPKQNKQRTRVATVAFFGLFILLMVGVMGGMFTMLSVMMCETFVSLGLEWMYFIIMTMVAIVLGTFGSVFNTYAGLYLARDNDLLLSMPIPVRYILASRLLGVYLLGLMYSGIAILPAVIVYWVVAPFSILSIPGGILLILLVSLIVLILSCALGWVVAKISKRLKNKSFVAVLVSLLFIGIYYFVYYKAQSLINELLQNAVLYGEKIKGAAYPLYLLGTVGEGDPLGMGVWTAGVVILLALTLYIMAHGFIRMATSHESVTRTAYRADGKKARAASPDRALLRREFARFTASPTYMLNCGMGALFGVAAAVFLFIRGGWLYGQLSPLVELIPGGWDVAAPIGAAAVCLLVSMVDITAPSVSLEGKTLWLSQSLPVTPWQVLRAKLGVQLWVGEIPAILCGAAVAYTLRLPIYTAVLTVLLPMLFVLLIGCIGLLIDLHSPNLTWTSEVTPIKQSMGVMAALFGGWGIAALLGVGGFFLGRLIPAWATLAVMTALIAVLSFLFLHRLKTSGAEKFARL